VEKVVDANLMAAAPDLLEALMEDIQSCSCTLRERESGHLSGCFEDQRADAAAALVRKRAKA
jgi:hypothetical protein